MKRTYLALCSAALICLPIAFSEGAEPSSNKTGSVIQRDLVKKKARSVAFAQQDNSLLANVSSGQVVFQVLLGELALKRGDVELASQAYADLAARTRDPVVMQRAIEVAGAARRFDLGVTVARLWLETEPQSQKAQQLYVSMMIVANRLEEAEPVLIDLLAADKASLPANLLSLNRMFALNPDKLAALRTVEKVSREFSDLPEAHYAIALAASAANFSDKAMSEVRTALALRPEWELPAFLGGQVLVREERVDEAIAFLKSFLNENPRALDVRLLLAKTLVAERRTAEVREQMQALLAAGKDNVDVAYVVAILALQTGDVAVAETQFKRVVASDNQNVSVARYFLGQIAEGKGDADSALADYLAVESGSQYLTARVRAASLLAKKGKLEEARRVFAESATSSQEESDQLLIAESTLLRTAGQSHAAFAILEAALATQPNQPDFLYESALLAEQLGRYELMETRLRKLISLNLDNARMAQAYNALGYSFSERSIRLDEAQTLIEKALTISGEDGYILDSMGWVLFRRGDLKKAREYLERAYAQKEDPEIAAHLGEVLWQQGEQEAARKLWNLAREQHPSNEVLKKTVERFANP